MAVNMEPHSHTLTINHTKLQSSYCPGKGVHLSTLTPLICVVYGDTTRHIRFFPSWRTKKRIEIKARKVIAIHDRGSKKAIRKMTVLNELPIAAHVDDFNRSTQQKRGNDDWLSHHLPTQLP
jgi:hypothetical protein